MTQPDFFFPVLSRIEKGDKIIATPILGLDIPAGEEVTVLDTVKFPTAIYLLVEYQGVGVGNLLPSDTEIELVPPF